MALVCLTGVAGVAAAMTLHLVDPNQPGHYPTCPTLALTGLFCPGCGALRALHFLTTGDLAAAWAMNPLAVLAVPYLVWSWLMWGYRGATGRPRRWLAPAWVLWTLLGVVLTWGVLRNVPGLEVLQPGGL